MEDLRKTVFVTGATGFIGSPTVRGLQQAGFRVVALLRSPSKRGLIEPWVDEFIEGNLNSESAIMRGIEQSSVVIHLASGLHRPWDPKVHQINIDGTQHVARVCARAQTHPHLIIVSSLAARGPTRKNGQTAPISAYGRAKRAAEDISISTYESRSITRVRPPMVFGPGDPSTKPIFDAIKRGLIPITKAPSAYFSMVDVRDLAAGLVKVAQHGPQNTPEPLYFAFKSQLRMEELAGLVAQQHGLTYRKFHCPNWLLWSVSAFSELYARLTNGSSTLNRDKYIEMTNGPWTCDPTLAEKTLNWKPDVSLPERLAQVFETYYPARS